MKLPKYQNAEVDKDKILKENKDKSGIYLWTNTINGKQYIGSAIDLSDRLWKIHSKIDKVLYIMLC